MLIAKLFSIELQKLQTENNAKNSLQEKEIQKTQVP